MKKTFIKLCSVAAIGLALTACNNDAANKAAQDSDNTTIDQLVQDKIKTLDDSLSKVCEDKVTLAAEEKIKSEPAPKGGAAHAPAHKPATTPKKEEPKKPADPKADKMNGNANSNTNAETKKDKMSGNPNTNTNAESKKSKMNGGK